MEGEVAFHVCKVLIFTDAETEMDFVGPAGRGAPAALHPTGLDLICDNAPSPLCHASLMAVIVISYPAGLCRYMEGVRSCGT